MIWICMLASIYLLNRAGSFWMWKARLFGSFWSDRISYCFFLLIGTVVGLTIDIAFVHPHFQFGAIWRETLAISLMSICLGELLYLRKMTSIIHTLAILRERNAHVVKHDNAW